ncbi:MAG: tetratricopeptide repeat protein, partial [Geopsychrobacter sp.]|nr:tetratricopeptide repeat protein [Geopsychrobacter sp.]
MTMLEGIVAKEPSNRNAWVQLGNAYFDANKPMKSIDAYDKALAIDGNDPNVLTDQGIMFRKVGWFDKAIKAFEKASKVDPSHAQSLFNLGVVYRYDLQDFPKAKQTWERYLQINPSGGGAPQVRSELDYIKNHPTPGSN